MLLVLKYLGLTYSLPETNCSSLLSVAVISVAVVADVYIAESSVCTDTLALLKASSNMSFSKDFKKYHETGL